MRLLNTCSHELEDFAQDEVPRYAILSHTWGHNEVSFADIEDGTAHQKKAYDKILGACRQARADDHQWMWIDTCCIDKKSSAELSEAINSMYAWYEKAAICYAYLSDVQINTFIMNSRWFTRGWTLQELLAPRHVRFYSREWLVIGTKHGLAHTIAKITGICERILTGTESIHGASTARKMSWASERATTKIEDIAYCLMGIFDVNMPLLYGEGDKAFMRLQEEIMKSSDDQSLFAWKEPSYDNPNTTEHQRGLLAKSPAWFMSSGSVFPYRKWRQNAPFSISNRGISIEVPLTSVGNTGLYAAALDCPPSPDQDGFIGMYLTSLSNDDDEYARVRTHELCSITSPGELRTIHVRQDISRQTDMKPNVYPYHVLQIRKLPSNDTNYTLDDVMCPMSSVIPAHWPEIKEPPAGANILPSGVGFTCKISKADNQLAAALVFKRFDGTKLFVLMGSATDYEVGFDVVEERQLKPLQDSDDFDELGQLQKIFKPREDTTEVLTEMSVDSHQVEVRQYTRVQQGVKYYLIHLEIELVVKGRRSEDTLVDR